jgi:hypothetical protein
LRAVSLKKKKAHELLQQVIDVEQARSSDITEHAVQGFQSKF